MKTLLLAAALFVGPLSPIVVYPENPTPKQIMILIGCDPLSATCTA